MASGPGSEGLASGRGRDAVVGELWLASASDALGLLLGGEDPVESVRHRDDLAVGEMPGEVLLDTGEVDGTTRGQPVPALAGDLRVGGPLVVGVGRPVDQSGALQLLHDAAH